MPVMPNYNAQVTPDIGGAQRVQTGGEAIGQGLQSLGSGINEAAIGLNHFNKLQAQKSEYQSNVNTDVFKAQQKPLIDDAIKNSPVNGDGITKSALDAYDKNVAAFLPTIPEAMRYKVKGELDVYRAGFANLATDAEHKTGAQYSLDTIKESYTSTQEAVKQSPSERATLQQGLFDRIDQAPYLTPLQRKELKDGYVNGIAIAEVKGLGGDDPDKIKALRDGTYAQKYGPGASDGLWKTMITKVENQSGDPGAVSSKGALGVAQVMPDTAREVARKLGLENVAYMNDAELQRYFKANPAVNEKIGRAYFDQQLQRYGGDQQAAVVAYNAGPGVADKYVASGKDPSVLPEETQNYLGKVFGGGTQSEEEAPDNMPDASSSVPNNATPDTIGLSRYLVAGKGMEHIRGMQKPLQQGLQAMLDAAPPGVKEALKIMSGYRSPERQQQLWDAALKKYGSPAAARKWVAPPGNSQHNHGNAADLAFDGAGTTAKLSPSGQAAMQWAHANASKFGLVFPLSNEPWHVEVAGARGGGTSAPNVSAGSDSGSSAGPGPAPQFASISMEQWDALVNSARSQQNQNQAIARGNLEPRVQDATSALMSTGRFDGAMPTQQDFTAAYGTIEGAQRFAQFRQIQDIGEHIDAFKSMTPQQIQADIEAAKPINSGAGFAMAQARYEAMAKAGAATIKLRDDDPAKYAITVSPGIAAKWQAANTPDGYRTALGAMAAFQTQIGVPAQNQKLLPDDRAQKIMAQYKDINVSFEQRVGAIKAAVLMTADSSQQKAVFRQLVNEGLPPEAEAALDRYAGGEQGAGDRLMTALMTDPTKLPAGAVTATPKDIKEQIQSTYSTWFDGRYGVSSGNPANLKAAEGAADLLTKATHLRLAQGAPDVQTAMAGAAQDLFGKDFKLMQATPNGRGASVAVPAGVDSDDLGQHLDEAMPAVIRTLANNIERAVSGFDKLEPGQLAALASDAANEARTVVANGKWVNIQGGYGFLDTKSGRLIESSPGKPLVIRMGEAIPEVPALETQQAQQPAPTAPAGLSAVPAAPVAAPAAKAAPAPAPANLPPINPTPADKVKSGLNNIQDQARQLREKALDPDQVESGGFFSGFFSGDGN